MSNKKRRYFTPQQKVAIVRRHVAGNMERESRTAGRGRLAVGCATRRPPGLV